MVAQPLVYPAPEGADGETALRIPADWRNTSPFAERFPDLSAVEGPQIDLLATRFATEPLVQASRSGAREFLQPDLAAFSPELVRAPFENSRDDLFIVQARSAKEAVVLARLLDDLRIPIRGHLPEFAVLARLLDTQVAQLQASPEVFWLGFFQPAWRIAPALDYIIENEPQRRLTLTAVFGPEYFRTAGALQAEIEALGIEGLEVLDVVRRERGFKARVAAAAIEARQLALMSSCHLVEHFVAFELHNNVARSSSATATARAGAAGPVMDVEDVWARGLRGEGQIVAVADTGLSTGDPNTLHSDFGEPSSFTNPSRLISAYALGRATWDDNQTTGGGHGTHVAGSVTGNGVRSGADPASNSFPASSYAGTAPKAELVFQSIMDSAGNLGGVPADLNNLFQPPYDDGARVHTNSWGSPVFGAYTSDSQEVDEFSWNRPDLVITYSAGNSGRDVSTTDGLIDTDSIGAPGTAKNSLTIGATENYRPAFTFEAPAGDCTSTDGIEQKTWGWFNSSIFSAAPVFSDLMADDASGLGAFSSRGPTDDGRFKPDLVAPGIAVTSTRTDRFQAYQQWGICDVPAALRPYYITLGGTSMSTPLTAGAAVLTRQYYADGWHGNGNAYTNSSPKPPEGFEPSAALVKATLINGAWDLAPGQYGAGPTQEVPPGWDTGASLPNNAAGYGRLDLEASLFPWAGYGRDPLRELEVHDVSPGLTTGQFDTYTVPVAASSDQLVATLVWTDPYAALGAGAKLVNDLDLTLISPSATTYLANGIDRTAGGADRLNNVEQVVVSSPEAGSWTVRVDGWSVPGNGQPGTTSQPYGLVVSGAFVPPCSEPAAPTGLVAFATASNRVELSWNPVAADEYDVYRATTPGGPYSLLAAGITALSYSDLAASGGTTYYYTVAAKNAPSCESAPSGEASATAFGDCTMPPSFSGLGSVGPVNTGGTCVQRLDWSPGTAACPGGPLVYNIYRSTTSGFSPGPGNLLQACVPDTEFDDGSAVSGTQYSYIVRAEDAALSGAGACRGGNFDLNAFDLSVVAGGDATSVVFADDFDGSQTPSDLWYFGLPADNPYSSGSCAALSYAKDWYRPETGFCTGNSAASNDGAAAPTYTSPGNGQLVLGLPPSGGPPFTDGGIVLPAGATSITLTFDHDYEFESSTMDWDGGRVRISVDDWPNFVDIAPVGGYPGTVANTTFFCTPFPGAAAYVGDSNGCVTATFDLTAHAGQRIWLAWNHGADNFSSTDAGWSIDNVRIEAATPSPCAQPPGSVQFLTATAKDASNTLEWLNPTLGYDSTIVRYRTDAFPTDPSDGTLLIDQAGTAGAHGSTVHGGLTNGVTYYYAAFVDNGAGQYSARRTVSARPLDTSGNVKWAYSTGASALAPPALGSVYGVANDRALHSMSTVGGVGVWPAGWTPMAMNAPAQSRPPVVPISLGGAPKVAFLGSQDGRVYAVDAASGGVVWTSPDLGGLIQAAPAGAFAAFGSPHDLLMVGSRASGFDNSFHGLNVADGTVAWSFTNSVAQGGDGSGIGIVSGTASVDLANSRVYFASRARAGGSQHTVWALSFNGVSATLLWSRDVGDVDGSPILHAGRLYVGTNNGELHALDSLTGADLWSAPFATNDGAIKGYPAPSFSSPEIRFSTTNTVWSVSDDGTSASLDWSLSSIPLPSVPLVSPSAPLLWIGGGDGSLYQVDFSAVPAVTSLVLGDGSAAVGSPALDALADRGYVGTDAGQIYEVELPLP